MLLYTSEEAACSGCSQNNQQKKGCFSPDKLEVNLFDGLVALEQMWDVKKLFDPLWWKPVVAAHPLARGNGLALLDSMGKAIRTVTWLKRKLNPFDVTNVSITAFAHKISMEIIEKGVIFRRECLGVTYWILLLPEYQYTVRILEHLQNYMIFHRAERLKLQHSIHERVRYLSSSLHFAVEVRGGGNFFLFLTWWRFVCWHCRSSEKVQGGIDACWYPDWCGRTRLSLLHYFICYLIGWLSGWKQRLSHPDCTCCRLVFTGIWLLFFTHRTHLSLSKPVKNTVCGGSEDVRWGEKSWRVWCFYWLKCWCPAVCQPGPLWQVCLLALSCRRWFPEFLLVINSTQTVRARVTRGPEPHR